LKNDGAVFDAWFFVDLDYRRRWHPQTRRALTNGDYWLENVVPLMHSDVNAWNNIDPTSVGHKGFTEEYGFGRRADHRAGSEATSGGPNGNVEWGTNWPLSS
jgi:hypothetical protein